MLVAIRHRAYFIRDVNTYCDVVHPSDIGQALVKSFVERGDHVIRVDQRKSSTSLGEDTTSFYEVDLASGPAIAKFWENVLKECVSEFWLWQRHRTRKNAF